MSAACAEPKLPASIADASVHPKRAFMKSSADQTKLSQLKVYLVRPARATANSFI